ncbi:DUF4258 domain-containing protein [Candidatus Pacearchaeota archaeon]|nr:DUF4258 domain-containing protein [Candidatus Pacearchaeota archaeon]
MTFIITKHAQQRMLERGIKLDQIKNTVNFPDYIISKDNKIEAYKKINNQILKVVYNKKGKFIKIITLIWR